MSDENFKAIDQQVEAGTEAEGLMQKAIGGKWSELNKRDGLSLLAFLGYSAGKLGAIGTAADAVVSGIDANTKTQNMAKELGVDLEGAARHSALARETLDERDRKVLDAGGNAVVSGGASIGAMAATAGAGAAIGTATGIPIVGTIAGGAIGLGAAILGGMAGSKAYDTLVKKESKDALALLAKIRAAQKLGVTDMPPEVVAAALLATMPPSIKEKAEADLEKLTGTYSFHKAVQDGKYKEIAKVMQKYDLDVRAQLGVLPDENNPFGSVVDQIAPAIQSGQLDARALIFDKDTLPVMQALTKAHEAQDQAMSNTPSYDVSDTSNLPPFATDQQTPVSFVEKENQRRGISAPQANSELDMQGLALEDQEWAKRFGKKAERNLSKNDPSLIRSR